MRTNSPLLINESPLQLLPSLAVALGGVNEAIILQQVQYWLTLSTNYRDGRVWVYKTYPEWKEEFPFWSEDTIGRTIRKLESMGILLSTDEYNQIATDRTKWYTIEYDVLNARAPQVATIEDGNLQPSRAPQVATILPETTSRILPETTQPVVLNENDATWIFQMYQDVFKGDVSAGEHDDLRELAYGLKRVTPGDVREAMTITKSSNAKKRIGRKVAYLRGIVQDWERNGKPVQVTPPPPKVETPIIPKVIYR